MGKALFMKLKKRYETGLAVNLSMLSTTSLLKETLTLVRQGGRLTVDLHLSLCASNSNAPISSSSL